MSKINLFISSKNRKLDETANKFQVILPDGLLHVDEDEFFVMKVINFNIFNQWYLIRNNYNNLLQLIKNDTLITQISINEGSPNALQLMKTLNESLNPIIITYDRNTNKYNFKNETSDNYKINIINCHKLLGFTSDIIDILSNTNVDSEVPINLITDEILNLAISGDIELKNTTLHNLRSSLFEPSSIIYQKFINNNPYQLSEYQNIDGGNNWAYELNNRESINYFTFEILNQNLEVINNLPEYYLTLQFEKMKKNKLINILESILDYLKNIFRMFGIALENYNII